MKRLILPLLMCLAWGRAGIAQQLNYINYGTVVNPPQIDATNFDNEGSFTANVYPIEFPIADPADLPYQFSDTVNFTNHNTMSGTPGFDFETLPSSLGQSQEAGNFVNGNATLPLPSSASVSGTYIVEVWSTNLVNRGLLQTSDEGLLRLHGGNVDLAGGGLMVSPFGPTTSADGMVNSYWGNTNGGADVLLGTQSTVTGHATTAAGPTNVPFFYYTETNFTSTNAMSLPVLVTNWFGNERLFTTPTNSTGVQQLSFVAPFASAQWNVIVLTPLGTPTNWLSQAIFVNTNHNSPGITESFTNYNVALSPSGFGKLVVNWGAPATNAFGQIFTNTLFLQDMLAQTPTNNFMAPTNGGFTNSWGGIPGLPTYQPKNFKISRSNPAGLTDVAVAGQPVVPYAMSGTNISITNFVFSSLGAQLTATNVTLGSAPLPTTITNALGRVEIVADGALNMNNSRVDSVGYLLLKAAHFVVSTNLSIGAPFTDLYLGSTNGMLSLANLTTPTISRLVGTVDAFSMVWSNMTFLQPSPPAFLVPAVPLLDTNTLAATNIYPATYNVLMVDSHLTNILSTFVENLVLTCTNAATNNVFIGTTNVLTPDIYNIQQSVSFNTPNLTIEPSATLNLLMGTGPDWEAQSPNILSLTNMGTIASTNGGVGLFFTGDNPAWSGNPYPPFPPYIDFVNSGIIIGPGIVVAANYVQNTGTLAASNGAVEIDAQTAQLSAGKIQAPTSDVNIACSNLLATNLSLTIGRTLSLSISNNAAVGANNWAVNDGFNLLVSPATGDLRPVAVTNNADTNAIVLNYWAAPDLGPSGFSAPNSCVLGHMVLNGSPNSFFYFVGQGSQCGGNPTVSNALYVDRLDLNGSAAVVNASGLANVVICTGMKIYFANVYTNGVLANAGLNGANGGALAGGTDSNPGKVFLVSPGVSPASIGLNVALGVAPAGATPAVGGSTSNAVPAAVITWNTVANATNYLYFKTGLNDANWQVLTNFVSGSQGGTVSVTDPANVTGRFYKVQVAAPPQ